MSICTFGCGSNWGEEVFLIGCPRCMVQYGRIYDDEFDDDMLKRRWDAMKVNKQTTESKLQDAEAKLKAVEAKLKHTEAKLNDAEAQLQKKESTLKVAVADTKLQTEIQDVWHSFAKLKAAIKPNVV